MSYTLDVDSNGLRNTGHRAKCTAFTSELLMSIFESSTNKSGGYDPPVVIAWSQVNRLWRNILLSMPHLWTTINICHRSADTFALRSEPLPISITFIEPASYWRLLERRHENGLPVARSIRQYAHRIQDMLITANPEVIEVISSAIESITFPLLSSMQVTSTWDTGIVCFQPTAPNLCELYLESTTLKFDPCVNLTHLYMENNRVVDIGEELLPFLARSPQLQMLALRDMFADAEELPATAPSVQLAHLQRFHLQDFDQEFVDYFFDHIFTRGCHMINFPYRDG
jgi:hypothetical protein